MYFIIYLLSTNLFAYQMEPDCEKVMVNFAKQAIKQSEHPGIKLNSAYVCSAKDLTPGSWDIEREVKVCGKDQSNNNIFVTLKTKGNYFCENEKLLGYKIN